MGNNNSSDNSALKQLLLESKQIQRLDHLAYGNVTLLYNEKESTIIASKLIKPFSKEMLRQYQLCRSKHLVRLLGSETRRIQGMCTGVDEITTAFFEYNQGVTAQQSCIRSLADELKQRRTRNLYMAQQEIVSLLQGLVDGLQSLDTAHITLEAISADMIMLTTPKLYRLCPIRKLFDTDEEYKATDPSYTLKYANKFKGQRQKICYLGFIAIECCTLRKPESFLIQQKEEVYPKQQDISRVLVEHKEFSRQFKSLVKKMICHNSSRQELILSKLDQQLQLLGSQCKIDSKKNLQNKSISHQQFAKELLPHQLTRSRKEKKQSISNIQQLKESNSKSVTSISVEDEGIYTHLRKARESYLISELYSPQRKKTYQRIS